MIFPHALRLELFIIIIIIIMIIIIIIIIIQAYIALFLGIPQRFTIYAIRISKTIIQTN